MQNPVTDINSHISIVYAGGSVFGSVPALVTAGGNGDAVKVTGKTVNRSGYDSMSLAIAAFANLTNTKLLKFAVEIQESADDSSWDAAEVIQASTTLLTATSSTVFSGCTQIAVNLKGRKQYVRFNITPDLDATVTDTALWTAEAVLGGALLVH